MELGTCWEREELGGGRVRHVQHLRPIAYEDGGALRRIVSDWRDSALGTRPHAVTAAQLQVTVASDGLRRLHPTRETDRWIEIGAPLVKGGLDAVKPDLGTAERAANDLRWRSDDMAMHVVHAGHYVKTEVELLRGWLPPDGVMAFPVALQGLTLKGDAVFAGTEQVARLRAPVVYDAGDIDISPLPIRWEIAEFGKQPCIVYRLPDLRGLRRPVIDPRLEIQPDAAAGDDTYMRGGASADTNFGAEINLLTKSSADLGFSRVTLIRFTIPALPGATLTAATLSLYNVDPSPYNGAVTISAFRCLRAWTEGDATWNKYDGANNWTAGGAKNNVSDYNATLLASIALAADPGANAELAFASEDDFLTYVDAQRGAAINLVMHELGVVDKNFAVWSSDYATAALRPKLVIEYTEPGVLAARVFTAPFTAPFVGPFGG